MRKKLSRWCRTNLNNLELNRVQLRWIPILTFLGAAAAAFFTRGSTEINAIVAILAAAFLPGVVLSDEDRLSLAELASEEKVHISTVHRWALRGVRGVKLETFLIGGQRFTTREAFQRWVGATNSTKHVPIRAQTNQQREAAIERANRACERHGI